MSYATIEAAVQTRIVALTDYSAGEVTRGDWRILSAPDGPFVVLRMGPFDREPMAHAGQWMTTWTIYIEIYARFYGDGTEHTNLQGYRQNIVNMVDAYPTLNSTSGVHWAGIRRGQDVRAIYDRDGGGPQFLQQILDLEVKEVSTASNGEW